MLKVENRESAHIRSRVKDLSVVPNVASFNALLACITPIAKAAKNAEGLYEPILVRDNETLIANFGDPKIDPEKYIDLYSIMQVVGNGGTCYVAKVDSGNAGVYQFPFLSDQQRTDDTVDPDDNTMELQPYTGDDEPANTYFMQVNNKYVVTGVKGYTAGGEGGGEGGGTVNFMFYTLPFYVVGDGGEIEVSNDAIEDAEDLPAAVATGEEKTDYSGRFTWKCVDNGDGTYDIRITLTDELPSDETLVAFGVVDPSWGAEPLEFTMVENSSQSPNPYDDSEAKVSTLVFESTEDCGDILNEYVITKFKHRTTASDSSDDSSSESSASEAAWSDGLPAPLDSIEGLVYDTELSNKKLRLIFTVPYNGDNPVDLSSLAGITIKAEEATRKSHSMIAYSSMSEPLTFKVQLSQVKPYSIHAFYLNVEVANNGGANTLGTAKIKLEGTTTNQGIVNALNSAIGTIVRFELMDPSTASACGVKERGANSIAQALLDKYCEGGTVNKMRPNPINLLQPITIESPSFEVDVNDYIDALEQYKAKKYVGCLMADMVCPVTADIVPETGKPGNEHVLYPLCSEDRRNLHYHMKDIARERKDTTAILSTPYTPSYDNLTVLTINDACDWVASQGSYADLWEYGQGATTDYATQSFYLEMYYSWLEMQCNWIVNGAAKAKKVKVAPANLVINNILTSWRERGVQYPVAGDQGGVLPETCTILMNPKTKLERDQLVQYRINPIWDTGTRGIQIFGNETLNAGYTDLNAAHIARLLVYIRSTIDEYTEKLKFSINNLTLWDKWKTYVSQYILEPLLSVNALKEYRIAMGEDTTSPEEIANRQINGIVQLIFYQSAEVFDLTYIVYSTSTTIDEAMKNV